MRLTGHLARSYVPLRWFARAGALRAEAEALLRAGVRLVTVPEVGEALAAGALPGRAAGLCVPGCAELEPELRWLAGAGVRATVFVSPAGLGLRLPAAVREMPPHRPPLARRTLDALLSAGVAVGCAGMTGRPLRGLSPEELRLELFDGRRVLVEQLGVPVPALSYPEGRALPLHAHAAAAAGYRWGLCGARALVLPGLDPLWLPALTHPLPLPSTSPFPSPLLRLRSELHRARHRGR